MEILRNEINARLGSNHLSQSRYPSPFTPTKMEHRERVKNEPISRMIEHFDSASGKHRVYTFPVPVLAEGLRARGRQASLLGGKRRGDAKAWRLFYFPNVGPNRTSSPLRRVRGYKCPPSRLYNHGGVKLTDQFASQPRNSLASTAGAGWLATLWNFYAGI